MSKKLQLTIVPHRLDTLHQTTPVSNEFHVAGSALEWSGMRANPRPEFPGLHQWIVPSQELLFGFKQQTAPGFWIGTKQGRRFCSQCPLIAADQLCFFFDQQRAYTVYTPQGASPTSIKQKGQNIWMQQQTPFGGLKSGDEVCVWHHPNQQQHPIPVLTLLIEVLEMPDAPQAVQLAAETPAPQDVEGTEPAEGGTE